MPSPLAGGGETMRPYQEFVTRVACTECGAPIGVLCIPFDANHPQAARVHMRRVYVADIVHEAKTGEVRKAMDLIPDEESDPSHV